MAFSHLTIEYEREMLAKEELPDSVKKAIRKFVDEDLVLDSNIGETRRMNYYQRLRVAARWIPDTFLSPSKDDMRTIMLKLNDGYKEWTKATYLKMLKKFYRSALPKSKFEKLFEGIKIKAPGPRILQSDLISEDEIRRIIESSKNSRDKALFATLYDSGCRIGEILNMKVKSISFDDDCVTLEVPLEGKTGTRSVIIVGNSIAYLRAWLGNHPNQNDLEAPLFCNLSDKVRGRTMTYDDVHSALRKTLVRAGIKRRIHPHLFRHTRASILAANVPEAPLESQMGWIHGSRQSATYVHLSGQQQKEAILRANGIEVKKEKLREPRAEKCPRCGEFNSSFASFCQKCWFPLTIEAKLEMDQNRKKIEDQIGNHVNITPEVRALINAMPEDQKNGLLSSIIEIALKKDSKKS